MIIIDFKQTRAERKYIQTNLEILLKNSSTWVGRNSSTSFLILLYLLAILTPLLIWGSCLWKSSRALFLDKWASEALNSTPEISSRSITLVPLKNTTINAVLDKLYYWIIKTSNLVAISNKNYVSKKTLEKYLSIPTF